MVEGDSATWQGGDVVFAGGTDWSHIGKASGGRKMTDKTKQEEARRKEKHPDQPTPVRLESLMDVKVMFVSAGSAACHSIIGDMNGVCYTWGRNNKGQLGHGDQLQRNVPTVVEALKGKKVTGGQGGKFHSVVVLDNGESWSWGSNLTGQCGTGTIKSKDKVEELILKAEQAKIDKVSSIAAGAEFTMWLCGGLLYSAGNPQYGVLGHGTDHEFNAKDSSVRLMYQPQPTPKKITAFGERRVAKMACGHQHVLAICEDGAVYTWGNGGYGRLGHKTQQDEFKPRQVEVFTGREAGCPDVAACSQTGTFCMNARSLGGQTYGWGKWKQSGDNTMYPKPFMDLGGWNVHDIAAGATHYAVAADKSCISWGHAQYGQLGYGASAKKSSANPDKVKALEGVECHQVACGIGHTLFLMHPGSDVVAKLGVFEPEAAEEQAADDEEEAEEEPAKGKGKGAAKGKAAGKRKAAVEPAGKRSKK